jgi:hypothetical protein
MTVFAAFVIVSQPSFLRETGKIFSGLHRFKVGLLLKPSGSTVRRLASILFM